MGGQLRGPTSSNCPRLFLLFGQRSFFLCSICFSPLLCHICVQYLPWTLWRRKSISRKWRNCFLKTKFGEKINKIIEKVKKKNLKKKMLLVNPLSFDIKGNLDQKSQVHPVSNSRWGYCQQNSYRLPVRGCRLEIIMDQDLCKSDLELLFLKFCWC